MVRLVYAADNGHSGVEEGSQPDVSFRTLGSAKLTLTILNLRVWEPILDFSAMRSVIA